MDVLLFEPDPDLTQMLGLLLAHVGCTVRHAPDSETARKLAEQEPALAVLDAEYAPNGAQLCQEIRVRSGAPVICLGEVTDLDPEQTGIDFVALPVSPQSLRTLVRSRLQPDSP